MIVAALVWLVVISLMLLGLTVRLIDGARSKARGER